MKKRCDDCNSELEFRKEIENENIDGIDITYSYEYVYCPKCKREVYDMDLFDANTRRANAELRKHYGIITNDQILELGKKYDIGNKSLSLILGFGEIQIDRYLKSGNPRREHSDIMLSVLKYPFIYEMYLISNKNKISYNVYKKSLSKLKQIEMDDENSKLYNMAEYVLYNSEDITNMSIQKVLYFINGFAKKFLGKKLFKENSEAWIHGPVYRDLYLAFCTYYKNSIDINDLVKNKEIDLTKEEKEYIDKILPYFSNYSGSALRNMSHLTDPWIKAREGLVNDDYSDRIIEEKDIDEYFDKVIKEYKIEKIEDVKRYAQDLFEKAIENK